MLRHYKKHPSCNKGKYDHTNSKWIDVDCIISIVPISYNATHEIFIVDRIDAKELKNL